MEPTPTATVSLPAKPTPAASRSAADPPKGPGDSIRPAPTPTPVPVTTATTSKYVRDFELLFVPIRVNDLRIKAQSGNLRHCQFRSLCWRYFLNCLPEQYDKWLEICTLSRENYEKIKTKHLSTLKFNNEIREQQPPNPISNTSDNTAISSSSSSTTEQHSQIHTPRELSDVGRKKLDDDNQYKKVADECDHRNVYRTIERDVVRTFPDMEFFRQTDMQAILAHVLFNFASENPQLSYKQGMHELLATLLYVAHTDSQNCLINHEGGYANETIATLLDLKYLESDVYHLFSALMKSIDAWYQNDEILIVPPEIPIMSNSNTGRHFNRFSSASKQQVSSVLGLKLKKISENIVKNYDRELFNHLEALQIAPQIYGIRWMRLLFGREFEFLDLLTVWDAIICDRNPMSLVDYVFASMLITIREQLVNGDYTDCLNNLMRHQFKDVPYVIKLALHLRDPTNYARPKAIYSVSFTNSGSRQRKQMVASTSSLTSKLSQQYISNRQYLQQQTANIRKSRFKEYEMREIQPTATSNHVAGPRGKLPIGKLSDRSETPKSTLNVSTESYDDLHSIVDYCWRLLSEQIDSLQRCLPKEKSLHSEDEIFVALAQLKKVRDVLKGSLKLEDELEAPSLGATATTKQS